MPEIDLDKIALEELKKLQKDVAKAIASFEARKLKDARAKVSTVAQELGYSLEELVGRKSKGGKSPIVPKYQHPENTELTWSGRGRQPAWFKEAVANGASKGDLEIG